MSNCCASSGCGSNTDALCPVSGTKGAGVELQTVKAMLTEVALRQVTTAAHRFCSDPACHIVYFAEDGRTFSKADLRVPVWQKEPAGARVVCYCFGENEANIRSEVEINGRSDAVERVRAHIKAGRCACEVRNPRGTCCLGDVGTAVRRIGESVAQQHRSAVTYMDVSERIATQHDRGVRPVSDTLTSTHT